MRLRVLPHHPVHIDFVGRGIVSRTEERNTGPPTGPERPPDQAGCRLRLNTKDDAYLLVQCQGPSCSCMPVLHSQGAVSACFTRTPAGADGSSVDILSKDSWGGLAWTGTSQGQPLTDTNTVTVQMSLGPVIAHSSAAECLSEPLRVMQLLALVQVPLTLSCKPYRLTGRRFWWLPDIFARLFSLGSSPLVLSDLIRISQGARRWP